MVMSYDKWESKSSTEFANDNYRTRGQLIEFYKNEEIVDAIISDKEQRGPPWVKPHPEVPRSQLQSASSTRSSSRAIM